MPAIFAHHHGYRLRWGNIIPRREIWLFQITKKLPQGWVTSYTGGTLVAPSPGWSWATIILPYIEQSTLYSAIAPNVSPPGGVPATISTPGV